MARTGFFLGRGPADGTDDRRPGPRGELARLLDAEYGLRPDVAVAEGAPAIYGEDAAVAALRRVRRLDVPLTPEAVLAHANPGPRLSAVLAELWPDTVRWHGRKHSTVVLRATLLAARGTPSTPFLLDLAASSGLSPLSASEAADLADAGHQRAVRHAAWRYLHDLPNGRGHLPAASTASDAYERMLLAPPDPCIEWDSRRSGPVIAQTMLLGGLDTPGQGLSGGLSVLLAGLGDQLAVTAGTGGVVTVVLAGHADFERNPDVSYERSPGHWILRLPVDAADPPPQTDMHAHRPALAWWAARLLGTMSRPLDVLHVRYADDGSLALAESAARLGARLVFTATPDPHRQLADAYAHTTPDTVDALRYDLHRVFVADRLVERADTVVAIPGRGGTGELVRHFPGLADVNEGMGPAAPPEGIAPYRPAPDEEHRQGELLSALFRGGDNPDALDPADRHLPLLLCVGRLHPVKQQDLLVQVWLASGLSERSTLVLVGGSPGGPGPGPEAEVRGRIATLLASHPQARSRFALIPAMANEDVRRLERALADPDRAARCWYVCPSAKEEFGIAVLEAMEAGLPAAGPLRGGVAHYLRDGVSGILLDTSSASGLTRGLRRLVAVRETDREQLARRGRDVVRNQYSVTAMADALAREYTAGAAHRPLTAGSRRAGEPDALRALG
ncbi:glycosyltransferase family 4 protein [Streptomyces sp. NPDC051362]|uniref:glycosyltransferase family 4 protein n=1 Tax=Streptomyces sp. NPDC051362 TaxID=3365651 RepID=UPI0037BBD876